MMPRPLRCDQASDFESRKVGLGSPLLHANVHLVITQLHQSHCKPIHDIYQNPPSQLSSVKVLAVLPHGTCSLPEAMPFCDTCSALSPKD